MLRSALVMILLPTLALTAGCSAKVNKNDLPGKYAITINDERQVIRINLDGTYDNALYRHDKLVWSYRDQWIYGNDATQGADTITFNHFQFGLAGYDTSSVGFWPVKPERSFFGSTQLCFDPDLNGRCFVKQEG